MSQNFQCIKTLIFFWSWCWYIQTHEPLHISIISTYIVYHHTIYIYQLYHHTGIIQLIMQICIEPSPPPLRILKLSLPWCAAAEINIQRSWTQHIQRIINQTSLNCISHPIYHISPISQTAFVTYALSNTDHHNMITQSFLCGSMAQFTSCWIGKSLTRKIQLS